jgi:hypothetical protein
MSERISTMPLRWEWTALSQTFLIGLRIDTSLSELLDDASKDSRSLSGSWHVFLRRQDSAGWLYLIQRRAI